MDTAQNQSFALEGSSGRSLEFPAILFEVALGPNLETLRFTYLNDYASEILGYSKEELLGVDIWSRMVHPEDWDSFLAQRSAISADADHGTLRYRLIAADGRILPVESRTTIVRDSAGTPIVMRGATIIVPERYKNEQRWRLLIAAGDLITNAPLAMSEPAEVRAFYDELTALFVPAFADACLVHRNEAGEMRSVAVRASSAYQEEVLSLETLTLATLAEGAAMRDAIDVKRSLTMSGTAEIGEYIRDESTREVLRLCRVEALLQAPIVLNDRFYGAITLLRSADGREAERGFDDEDCHVVEEIARELAVWLHKAELFAAARGEVDRRRVVQERMEFLAHASVVLASTVEAPQAIAEVCRLFVPNLADIGFIVLRDPETGETSVAGAYSEPPALLDMMTAIARRFPVPEGSPFGLDHVLCTGQPQIYFEYTQEDWKRFSTSDEHRALLESLGITSSIMMPLVAHGRIYGAIALVYTDCSVAALENVAATRAALRRFSAEDVGFVEEIARRAALAIYKSNLLETARTELEHRRRLQGRLELLERMSKTVAESLDVVTLAERAFDLLLPRIAEWGTIDIQLENGDLQHLAIRHFRPEDQKKLEPLEGKIVASEGQRRAIAAGVPFLRSHVERETLKRAGIAEERIEWMGAIGARSVAHIPLISRRKTLGVLTLVHGSDPSAFREEDRFFLLDIGSRIATGIDNARLLAETERQRAELESIYHNSPIGLTLIDRDFRYVRINEALANANGIPWEQHIGRTLDDVLAPELSSLIKPIIQSVFSSGEAKLNVELHDLTGVLSDAREFSTISSYFPLRDRHGEVVAVSISVVDTTEQRNAEARLREAKEAAEVASRTKDQFIAALSHELRTPLTPVLATVDLLSDDSDFPESFRPFIELIRRNIEIEARLIDDLLDVTRIAKGKIVMNESEVDLHQVLPRVLEICARDLERKQMVVHSDFAAERATIRGDEGRLQQVFWNLVHNAVKFTPQIGADLTVRTYNAPPLSGEGDSAVDLVIEVADNGRGIQPADLERIFNPFEQDVQARINAEGGLGLGLAISKSLVEMHGGTITAQSEGPGHGSTFTVRFGTLVEAPEQSPLLPLSAASHDTKKKVARGRILLVDDHPDTNNALKLLLQRRGYEVMTAASVVAGSQLAAEHPFDLLVSDIGLPDGDGIELLQRVRAMRNVKAIAVSGYGTDDDTARSLEAGFALHLKKPVAFADLEQAIDRLLSDSEASASSIDSASSADGASRLAA